MATLYLKILTADKSFFEGDVDRLVVRTTSGDVGILPRHIRYVAPIGIGGVTIYQNGQKRMAAISGGFVDVEDDATTIIARTCEWSDEIDLNRAKEAEKRAQDKLKSSQSQQDMRKAEVKLKKAMNRIRISQQ